MIVNKVDLERFNKGEKFIIKLESPNLNGETLEINSEKINQLILWESEF